MANLCTVQRLPQYDQSTWAYDWGPIGSWANQAKNASTVPYLFDADSIGVSCVAFGSNGSANTLLSYQTQINQLQSSLTVAQSQLALVASCTSSGSSTGPFNIEPLEAGQIAIAVFSVWAVGWAIRMLIRAVNSSSPHDNEKDV